LIFLKNTLWLWHYKAAKTMKNSNSSSIRVLRVLSRMNYGGPSRHVINLTACLQKYGYETRLLVGIPESAEGSMLELAHAYGVDPAIVARLDRPVMPLSDFAAFQQIMREIRSFRPHIVHTHTTKAGILGRLAAVLCGVPAIFHTYHGFIFSGYFSQPVSQLIVGVERFLAGMTDRLITLTPSLAGELSQRLGLNGSKKIETVSLGLNLNKNLMTPRRSTGWRKSLNLSENHLLVGIVARLVPVKNHQLLLQAVAELTDSIPELHLAIIGGGELESSLRQQATASGISDRVHFCGLISEIEEVYADLDLLVLSSKNEGTPVVIIEALASGCPVAATNVGGVAELLEGGEYGAILPPETEAFTLSLKKALENCRWSEKKLDLQFRRQWSAKFSVDGLGAKINEIYMKTLKLRGIDAGL